MMPVATITSGSGSQGSLLMFEELHPDLAVPFPAAEIVGDGLFPKQPQAAPAGPGWVVAWFDGRLDVEGAVIRRVGPWRRAARRRRGSPGCSRSRA